MEVEVEVEVEEVGVVVGVGEPLLEEEPWLLGRQQPGHYHEIY